MLTDIIVIFSFPNSNRIIIACTNKSILWVRKPINKFYILCMPFKYWITYIIIWNIIKIPNPNILISTTWSYSLIIETPIDTLDLIFMSLESRQNLKLLILIIINPNRYGWIKWAYCYFVSFMWKFYSTDCFCMISWYCWSFREFLLFIAPYCDCFVWASTDKSFAFRMPILTIKVPINCPCSLACFNFLLLIYFHLLYYKSLWILISIYF